MFKLKSFKKKYLQGKITLLILSILLISFLIIVFGISFKNQLLSNSKKEYTIQLTGDGFKPQQLEINLGDTVKFTTSVNQQFWPASDPHPTHQFLDGFDPKKPIDSNSSWSFTFNKSG